MKHDPTTINCLVPTRLEELRHVTIIAWKVVMPCSEHVIKLTVFRLPSFHVCHVAYIHWLFEKFVYPG
jgi:hypothetical protein